MNKLDLESKNIIKENIEKIREIFPNVVTEGVDGLGINFDILKQELSNNIIESNRERYQLVWPRKQESIYVANTRTTKTLRPLKEKSVDFNNTKNIYIEGDNLEVLKILQESYLGKIKCIYVDPPYNTGSDFIYNDNFSNNLTKELIESGQVDENGQKYTINSDSNGRYHSNWLNMIYPRLKLARSLLTEDGIIFISIDDNEYANLKKVCDEIFGELNFIANIVVQTGEVFGSKAAHISKTLVKVKDYVLVYQKKETNAIRVPLFDSTKELFDSHYSVYIDENLVVDTTINVLQRDAFCKEKFEKYGLKFTISNINKLMKIDEEFTKYIYEHMSEKLYTSQPYNQFLTPDILKELEINDLIISDNKKIYRTQSGSIRYYQSLKDSLKLTDDFYPCLSRATARGDLWSNFHYDMRNIAREGEISYKNGKKPIRLIKNLLKWANLNENDIVLDFFSGSASTAHAVLSNNAENNVKNSFIMVQIDEEIDKINFKEEYNECVKLDIIPVLCSLGQERIRRAAKKIKEETNANIDYGFRVYKVDESNMKDVYYKPNEITQDLLESLESNIKDDRNNFDLLTQVILDLGLTLDLPTTEKSINNNLIMDVDNGTLLACFDENISVLTIEEMAKNINEYGMPPEKIVVKESAFSCDQELINANEKIKNISLEIEFSLI